MRTVSGTCPSTPLQWLLVLEYCPAGKMRNSNSLGIQAMNSNIPLQDDLANLSASRLTSRKPFWIEEFPTLLLFFFIFLKSSILCLVVVYLYYKWKQIN